MRAYFSSLLIYHDLHGAWLFQNAVGANKVLILGSWQTRRRLRPNTWAKSCQMTEIVHQECNHVFERGPNTFGARSLCPRNTWLNKLGYISLHVAQLLEGSKRILFVNACLERCFRALGFHRTGGGVDICLLCPTILPEDSVVFTVDLNSYSGLGERLVAEKPTVQISSANACRDVGALPSRKCGHWPYEQEAT